MRDFDSLAHDLGDLQNARVHHRPAKRRPERDHRRDVIGTLPRRRPRDDTAEAVPDEMDPATGLAARTIDGVVESPLDQQVRAFGIQPDSGKIGVVADALQPRVHLHQVKIGAEKSGDHHDAGAVAVRNANAVVGGRGAQQEHLDAKERFLPHRNRRGGFILANLIALLGHISIAELTYLYTSL